MAHTLDGIDGKQARRTGSSSPLGEMFDHGLDSWSTSLFLINFISRKFFHYNFKDLELDLKVCYSIYTPILSLWSRWNYSNRNVYTSMDSECEFLMFALGKIQYWNHVSAMGI